jgi:hypothetical protein
MTRAHSSRCWSGGISVALVAIVLGVLPGSAAAVPAGATLSPRLAKLATPALLGASARQQAKSIGLAGNGLARDGRRVLARVRFDEEALSGRGELREAGAEIVGTSSRYQTITVSAPLERLHAIAAVPGVQGVLPVLSPVTAAAPCPSGAVVSEGDVQLNAEAARKANPGVDGTGVSVGILSDSFNQASEDQSGNPIATKAPDDVKSADLPGAGNECGYTTPVAVLKKDVLHASTATDEGRAMTQIVHDLAPGANLRFASAFNEEEDFADNIRELAAQGTDVIADDVFYYEEPFFQDGPIAVAVREAVEAGATYFSAAGNDNLTDEGGDIASWETPEYRDAQSCPPAIESISSENAFHCLDFDPGTALDKTFGIRVEAGTTLTVDLQWDEAWNGVDTNLDAFLLNSAGSAIPGAEALEDNVEISQRPVEVLEWANESSSTKTVQLVVNRVSGGTPRVKFALLENGGGVKETEYPRSSGEDVVGPTIFGHSGSASAISVGAVPFATKSVPEPYSSHGPVRHDWGPVEGVKPAASIATETLSKPDLVATDCGRTTFFSFFEVLFGVEGWHFCGTSAAAPHAAAVAALMLDAKPTAKPAGLRAALMASAAEVGTSGPCSVGVGLVEAAGAIEDILAHTGAAGPTCDPPESEIDPEAAAAPGNWGSEVPPPPSGRSITPIYTPPSQPDEEEEAKRVPNPRTFFLQRPSKIIRTRHQQAKAVFRFGSNESDASFVCRVDGSFFRPCAARLARHFTLGWHVVKVAALDAAGNGDKTPASYSFKVKKVR